MGITMFFIEKLLGHFVCMNMHVLVHAYESNLSSSTHKNEIKTFCMLFRFDWEFEEKNYKN